MFKEVCELILGVRSQVFMLCLVTKSLKNGNTHSVPSIPLWPIHKSTAFPRRENRSSKYSLFGQAFSRASHSNGVSAACFCHLNLVMNETIKPYLAAEGQSPTDVDKMHLAWCKSLQLQVALWTHTYTKRVPNEW